MNTLVQINDWALHAPAGALAMLFAIILGYMLKVAQFFPNNRIPWAVVPSTALLFSIVQLCADVIAGKNNYGLYLPLNFMLGFIFGGLAWLLHAQILKRFLDPKLFNDDGSTKFLHKPTNPPNP